MIIQNENDNKIILSSMTHLVNSSVTRIKVNNTATFKNNLNNRKQERRRIRFLFKCNLYRSNSSANHTRIMTEQNLSYQNNNLELEK
jgi:hypothetical protein